MDKILNAIGSANEGVFAIFVNDKKEILKGLRHYDIGPIWTMPGGRCSGDETVEATLKREVLEEIGIKDFEIKKYLGKFPGGHTDIEVYVFYCTTPQEPKNMEPEKFSEWKWMGFKEFKEKSVGKDYIESIEKLMNRL